MTDFLENRPQLRSENSGAPKVESMPGFRPFLPPAAERQLAPLSAPSLQKPAATAPESAPPADGSPKVELVNRDGQIERIIVTCTCCKRIELECRY